MPGTQNAIADGLSRMPKAYFEKNTIGKDRVNNGKEKKTEREGMGNQAKLQERGGKEKWDKWEGKDEVEERDRLNKREGKRREGKSGRELADSGDGNGRRRR